MTNILWTHILSFVGSWTWTVVNIADFEDIYTSEPVAVIFKKVVNLNVLIMLPFTHLLVPCLSAK